MAGKSDLRVIDLYPFNKGEIVELVQNNKMRWLAIPKADFKSYAFLTFDGSYDWLTIMDDSSNYDAMIELFTIDQISELTGDEIIGIIQTKAFEKGFQVRLENIDLEESIEKDLLVEMNKSRHSNPKSKNVGH